LCIIIEDNGVGLAASAALIGSEPHQSLATSITQNRLLMLRKSLKNRRNSGCKTFRKMDKLQEHVSTFYCR